MQMRPQLQIKSMIKAMSDVVLPAIDADNKLAQEQGRLVIGMLSLLAKQLPLQFQFDRDELLRLIALAETLYTLAKGGPQVSACVEKMSAAVSAARLALRQSESGPNGIETALRGLKETTSMVVRAAYIDGNGAAIEKIQEAVLSSSKEQLLRDRAWVLMQGWEPDPEAIPKIESLIAAVAA